MSTLLLAASWLAGCGVRAVVVSPDEMWTKDQWFEEHLSAPQPVVPFSFVCGGKKSDANPGSWTKATRVQTLDPDHIQHTFTWTDRQTGLESRRQGWSKVRKPLPRPGGCARWSGFSFRA